MKQPRSLRRLVRRILALQNAPTCLTVGIRGAELAKIAPIAAEITIANGAIVAETITTEPITSLSSSVGEPITAVDHVTLVESYDRWEGGEPAQDGLLSHIDQDQELQRPDRELPEEGADRDRQEYEGCAYEHDWRAPDPSKLPQERARCDARGQ